MIGYYVHHVGDGHLTRAGAIARRLDAVTGLSSRPRPAGWTGPWLQLASDEGGAEGDPTAGGALHWAPVGHPGLRERMAQIAAWVATHAPRLVVVDVSVEVTVLVRAMGVPTVVIGMPGERRDRAHQLGYRMADAIIGAWPQWASVWEGDAKWRAKTYAVGAISRFDDRDRLAAACGTARDEERSGGLRAVRRRVLVLSGRGGTSLKSSELSAAERATPEWEWTVLGPPGTRWVEDPWPLLCAADVIVTHAGQNAIADVAAARRPAVVIPQPRPHDEQVATARALDAAGLAVVLQRWPGPGEWRTILDCAMASGGDAWSRWNTGAGADDAATVLKELTCARR